MKFEHNWRSKTLENLEKDNWGDPPPDSTRLVQRIMQLRRVPLDQFTTEDLRITIGQQCSLPYVLALAHEVLSKDLFAEGDFYAGDLLNAVLQVDHTYWSEHTASWSAFDLLFRNRLAELKEFRPRLAVDHFYQYPGKANMFF